MGGFRTELLNILGESIVVDSIEKKIVLQRVNAVYVEVAGASGRAVARLLGVSAYLHTGNCTQQVVPVPEVQRGVGDGVLFDNGANGGVVRRQAAFVLPHFEHLLNGSPLPGKVG